MVAWHFYAVAKGNMVLGAARGVTLGGGAWRGLPDASLGGRRSLSTSVLGLAWWNGRDASGLGLHLLAGGHGHGRGAMRLARGDAALADEVEDRGHEEDGRDDDRDDDGER